MPCNKVKIKIKIKNQFDLLVCFNIYLMCIYEWVLEITSVDLTVLLLGSVPFFTEPFTWNLFS